MNDNKIPRFIEEFDLKLFVYIAFRRAWLILVVFVIVSISCYLLLRYSQPIYESSVILQVEKENRPETILVGTRYSNEHFSKKIELLHSRVFFNRVLKQLPVDVSYFNEGKFLYHDIYGSWPFQVHYVIQDFGIYDNSIHLKYINDTLLSVSYFLENQSKKIETLVKPNQWTKLPGFELFIQVDLNDASISSTFMQQKYFMFIIHNPDLLYDKYIGNVTIQILNEPAKTFEIKVRDKNPKRAVDFANKIVDEFQKFEIERKSLSSSQMLEFIDEQIIQAFRNLSLYEDSIMLLRKKSVDTFGQQKIIRYSGTLNETERELTTFATYNKQLQSFLDFLAKENIDEYQLLSYFYTLPVAQQLQPEITKLSELLKRKEEVLQHATPQSSFIESLNHQIERQKQFIITILKNIQQSVAQKYQLTQQQYHNLSKQLYKEDHAYLYDLRRLERLYSISEQFYNQLITKKTEMSILRASFVPEIIVLKNASNIPDLVYPDRKKIFGISFLGFFVITIFILLLSYLRFDEIISSYEIKKNTKVPIIGVLPAYPLHSLSDAFIIDKYPQSILAESFRTIRSNMQFISNSQGNKIIAITSTISGEGKTFVALNLALIFSIADKKVVLVDLDMRRPMLHKYFNLSNIYGMSTLLSNQSTLEQSIQNSGKFSIDIITAGPIPPNPSELINSKQFEIIVKSLSETYQYIIFDAPPIGLVSDALRALQIADYPIYVIRAKFSKRSFIQMPNKLYNFYNLRNTTIILNAFDRRVSNLSFEKDITFSYAYVNKKSNNVYYSSEPYIKNNFWQRIKNIIKR